MRGLDPRIPIRETLCSPKRDRSETRARPSFAFN
jgi:hypothetical protein